MLGRNRYPLLTGDADRAAADANLNKIGPRVGQVAKAFPVDDIAGSDQNPIAILPADPLQRVVLPFAETVRRVDAQNIRTGGQQSRHAFLVITGVDSGTNDKPFIAIKQFHGVLFVFIVILAENQGDQLPVLIDDGQLIDFIIPDDIIGFVSVMPSRA